MRRYTIAYAAWLSFVISAAGLALWWYRKVAGLTPSELLAEMRGATTEPNDEPDVQHNPEVASVSEWGGAG